MERAGYKIVSSDENLFNNESGASDYQVAAVVTDAHISACVSQGNLLDPGKLTTEVRYRLAGEKAELEAKRDSLQKQLELCKFKL